MKKPIFLLLVLIAFSSCVEETIETPLSLTDEILQELKTHPGVNILNVEDNGSIEFSFEDFETVKEVINSLDRIVRKKYSSGFVGLNIGGLYKTSNIGRTCTRKWKYYPASYKLGDETLSSAYMCVSITCTDPFSYEGLCYETL